MEDLQSIVPPDTLVFSEDNCLQVGRLTELDGKSLSSGWSSMTILKLRDTWLS